MLMILIYRMVLSISFSALLIFQFSITSGQDAKVIIDDNFSSSGDRWREVKLNVASKGSFSIGNHMDKTHRNGVKPHVPTHPIRIR